MKKRRIIPRFDVKGPNVVKGICLEGLRVVGKPADFARKYYQQGADEIVYIDIVASLYERNNLVEVIEEAASLGISIPLTVGGGIRSLEDITKILRAGADKVAINTAATRNPQLIQTAARRFGSQCIVGSVQAKTVTLSCTAPTTREDGDLLLEAEIAGYEARVMQGGDIIDTKMVETCSYTTPELGPGTYEVSIRTIDTTLPEDGGPLISDWATGLKNFKAAPNPPGTLVIIVIVPS